MPKRLFRMAALTLAWLGRLGIALATEEGLPPPPPPPPVQERSARPVANLVSVVEERATAGLQALDRYDSQITEIASAARAVNTKHRKSPPATDKDRWEAAAPFFAQYFVLTYAHWMGPRGDQKRVLLDTESEIREVLKTLRETFTSRLHCAAEWKASRSLEACEGRGACWPDVGTDGKGNLFQIHVTRGLVS